MAKKEIAPIIDGETGELINSNDYESQLPAPMDVGQTTGGYDGMSVFHKEEVSFTTMKAESFEDRLKMASIIQNAEKLADHMNEVLNMVDVFAVETQVRSKNDETKGQLVPAIRTVVVTAEGKAYASASSGVSNSFASIFAMAGNPARGAVWERPIPVKCVEETTSTGNRVKKLVISL